MKFGTEAELEFEVRSSESVNLVLDKFICYHIIKLSVGRKIEVRTIKFIFFRFRQTSIIAVVAQKTSRFIAF